MDKLNIYFITSLFIIIGYICHTTESEEIMWNNHVYNGRHLDDLATATTVGPPNVTTPTLLIMYSSRCEKNMRFLKDKMLPPASLMVFAKHDYERFPEWIWYRRDDRDDLRKRYTPRQCPEYLYFKSGGVLTEPERHIDGKDKNIVTWLSEKITIEFTIVNKRPKTIKVSFDSMTGHDQPPVTLSPGDSKVVRVFISNMMYVTEQGYIFIYAAVINASTPEKLFIRGSMKMESNNAMTWIKEKKREISIESSKVRNWRHAIAGLYLLNFKQPVVVPRFTTTGYMKSKIPTDLYEEILKYYKDQHRYRVPEENDVEPAINDSEVKCYTIILNEALKNKIKQTIQPMLEEWCKSKLTPTYIYGIREYYTGNILRTHVDRLETHVVSVIIQVHKNNNDNKDWPLEIIDFNGKRRNVYLDSGEMLFYESASLIHGRPKPFKGESYANIFMHFSPVSGWGWATDGRWIRHNTRTVDSIIGMTPIYHNHPKPKSYHEEL